MKENQVDVKITAQTDQFNNAINSTNDKLKGLGVNLSSIASAAKLLAGAFAINEIRQWGEEIGKVAEQIQRTSQMTGLATDAVQEFNFAVTMGGGSAETAAATILRLERNMVDAADATSQSALAFQAMGISTKDAEGKMRPVQAVLNDIANYFKSTADGAAKTALAMQIMGRGGAELIPILNQGAEGLAEMNKALAETNSKMSSEQIEKFAKLDEAIDILSASWEGFKLAVSDFFEPAYTIIVNGLKEIVQWATRAVIAINGISGSVSLGNDDKNTKPDAATPKNQKQIADAKSLSDELLKLKKTQDEQFLGMDSIRNQHALSMGQKNNEQFLETELKLAEKKAEIDAQYYLKKQQAAKGNELELVKIENERLRADIQNSENITKIKNKQYEEAIKDFNNMANSVTMGWQSMTEKLIRGTATFKQAFKSMCLDLVVEFAKMQVANVAKALWAAAMGKGISITSMIAERGANAVKAASATYASVASIPYVGWILAPAAAAAAFTGVMAFGLPSAAGGWDEVPNDGLAMIHKKEMVLPAPLAEKVRNMSEGGNSGNTYHFNISALDGNSVKDMFMKNGSALIQSLNAQTRNLNPMAMAR